MMSATAPAAFICLLLVVVSCSLGDEASQPAIAQDAISTRAFDSVWQRTDAPVAAGTANRTWIWGPLESAIDLSESYSEAPDGRRDVRYFDKSRMELTHPEGDPESPWYVTNGLLVVEMMTGRRQVGDSDFEVREPASNPVAGDPDSDEIPTYASLMDFTNLPARDDGEAIAEVAGRDGSIREDPELLAYGVNAAHRVTVPGIDHQVASVFWEFMNSTGPIQVDGALLDDDLLFISPFFATGYPLTEAYWVNARVGGVDQTILFQAFERRVLTYTPGNPDGWKVESGNVGLHYYDWLYGVPPTATPEPTSTNMPVPTAAATPSPSAVTSPTATIADQPELKPELVTVGPGAVDAWMRSVVRDANDRVWIVAIDNNQPRTGSGPGRLLLYRATSPGIPIEFELVQAGVVESASDDGEIVFADAAMDAQQRLHIVWVDRGQSGVPIMYGVFDLTGATWAVPGNKLDDTGLAGFGGDPGQGGVSIAIDQTGGIRVAYVATGNHTQIKVRENTGAGWVEPVEPLGRESSFVWHPVLAVSPDGTWYLAGYDATRNEIIAARDVGQGWSETGEVATSVLGPESIDQGPTMLVSADGVPYVLFVDAGSYLRLRAFRGGSWEDVGPAGDYFTHAPGLGMFANGTLTISGHDEFQPPSGMSIIYGNESGWSDWAQLVSIEADGSAVFRWAGANSRPSQQYVDLVFFDEDLNDDGQFDDQMLYYVAVPGPGK